MKPNDRYLDRITRWLPYARRYFYVPADSRDLLCYGTGWDSSRWYAPDRTGAMRSIDDLARIFDQLAP